MLKSNEGTESSTHEEQVANNNRSVEEIQADELGSLFRTIAEERPEKESLQGEEKEGDDVGGEDAEGEGEDAEDAEEGDEENDEEEVEEEEKTELQLLKEQNEALLKRLEALEGKKEEEEEEPQTQETVEVPAFDASEILTEDEYDDMMQTREGANKALNKVAQQATEFVLKNQVGYVQTLVKNQVAQTLAVRDFFKENPDLLEHRKSVASAYNMLKSESPEASIEQIFAKLPATVRALKGIKAPEKEAKKEEKKKNPANRFAKSNSSNRTIKEKPEKPDDVGSQILAMEKSR